MKKRTVITACCAAVLFCGCGTTKVKRMDVEEVKDISGYWNDTDSQMVAETVVKDCLNHSWYTDYAAREGRKPVVIVGDIRNRSNEHIATETFTKDLERALINSGKVKFVADSGQRGELRQERREQQEFAREETAKRLAAETGADYMLKGSINSILDKEGKREVKYYQVDLELIHIESNEKVWIGTEKIKKYVKRARFKL